MLIGCGADQGGPERRLLSEITDQRTLGSAQLRDLRIDCGTGREIAVTPLHHRIERDDLHRLGFLVAEPGGQVGVAGHHRLHGVVQAVVIKPTTHGDVQLHRVHIITGAVRNVGMEQQPLLQRRQRQDIGDLIPAAQVVDLLLIQASRRDVL